MKKLIVLLVMFLAACDHFEVDEHRGVGVSNSEIVVEDMSAGFTIEQPHQLRNSETYRTYVEFVGGHTVEITIDEEEVEKGRITITIDRVLRGYIHYDGEMLDEKYNDNLNVSIDILD